MAETTLRIGIASDPDVLDPTLSRSVAGRQVFASLCDKLVDIDETLSVVPQLATAWRWEADGLSLVLELRPGVRFHDGAKMDAAAVVASLERHLKTPGSTRRGELGPVREVVATGPLTVRIVLGEPFAPLLAALSDRAGMIVSPRQAEVTGAEFARAPACAGPFKFVRRVAQDRIDLERFAEYWDAERIHVDRVVFRPIPDTTVRAANLRAGQLDIIERVLPSDIDELRRDRRVVVQQVASLASVYIAVNMANGPAAESAIGRDARLREALELAIDRTVLNRVAVEGMYLPGNQSVPPGHPMHVAALPVPGRDLTRAKALVQAIGGRPRVRMSVPNTTEYVQAAEAGIELQLQVIEVATLLRQWTAGEFESLVIAWSGRTDIDQNLWGFNACGEALNGGKYCNSAVDAALRAGRRQVAPQARQVAYAEAMRILLAERPYIYLWNPVWFFGTAAKLRGLAPVPDGLIRPQGIRLE